MKDEERCIFPASEYAKAAHRAAATRTALGAEAGTPLDFARFLVILAATHLFFEAAPLDQLAEATHRFLN
jgi:hypothetical protein